MIVALAAGLWVADTRLRKSSAPQKTSRKLDLISYCISALAVAGLLLQFIKADFNNRASISRTASMQPRWDNFENTIEAIEKICVKSNPQNAINRITEDRITDCERANKIFRTVFYSDWLESGKIINLAPLFEFKTPEMATIMRQFSDVSQKLNKDSIFSGVIVKERSVQTALNEQLFVLGLTCLLAFGAGVGAVRRWFDYKQQT